MSVEHTGATKFLNVDLDIHARSGLDELIDGLASSVTVLNRTDVFASVELSAIQPQSVGEAVLAYTKLIKALPPKLSAIWEQCETRAMNIGIQSGAEPHQVLFSLSEATISLLSSIRAEVIFTIYGCQHKNK